jgi:phosphoribosylamine--glycine ligase
VINGLDKAAAHEGVTIFHSGTAFEETCGNATVRERASTQYLTAGGRVLGVTATGTDLRSALDSAYAAVNDINWPGMQYRRDIGN